MRRLLTSVAALALVLAGCSPGESPSSTSSPSAFPTDGAEAPAEEFLAYHSLVGMDAVEIIDHLDRLAVEDRPNVLMASVQPGELVLSGTGEGGVVELPEDSFYGSVAPYMTQTHACFYHSLTTFLGELGDENLHVQITDDATGDTVVVEQMVTFDNGFIGSWVPRGVDGTITVTHDGRTGETELSVTEDGTTSITDLQLA